MSEKKRYHKPGSLQPNIEDILQWNDLPADAFEPATSEEKENFIQERKSVSYWKDAQIERAKNIDINWKKEDGNNQKTKDDICYVGTILEHLILENLICSLNIGEHGNIKLEDGDWNDQLDMASNKGETIPFTAFYGKNMCDIADLLEIQMEKEERKTISVFEEMEIFWGTVSITLM